MSKQNQPFLIAGTLQQRSKTDMINCFGPDKAAAVFAPCRFSCSLMNLPANPS
jgi:hypothetical protein